MGQHRSVRYAQIAHVQYSRVQAHTVVSIGPRDLFDLNLYLHRYFVNKGSKALASPRICEDSRKHSLLADTISHEISCAGPIAFKLNLPIPMSESTARARRLSLCIETEVLFDV